MQNYHFAPEHAKVPFSPGGNFLSLISKNYYEIIVTRISWLRNLFHNLMNIYAWNNNILPKSTKIQKLITGAMDLETHMKEYHGEACDDGYVEAYLHATTGGQSGGDGWRIS